MTLINKDNAECALETIRNKGDIGIDDLALCSGLKKGKVLEGLKIGSIVILNSNSLGGDWPQGKIYAKIYNNKVEGKVTMVTESYNHYSFGQYASVKWDNGHTSEWIHTSYLKLKSICQ